MDLFMFNSYFLFFVFFARVVVFPSLSNCVLVLRDKIYLGVSFFPVVPSSRTRKGGRGAGRAKEKQGMTSLRLSCVPHQTEIQGPLSPEYDYQNFLTYIYVQSGITQ